MEELGKSWKEPPLPGGQTHVGVVLEFFAGFQQVLGKGFSQGYRAPQEPTQEHTLTGYWGSGSMALEGGKPPLRISALTIL